MKTAIEVTDKALFDATVREVLTDYLSCTDVGGFHATGEIVIIPKSGTVERITGEHGKNDYRNNYGFKLIPAIS